MLPSLLSRLSFAAGYGAGPAEPDYTALVAAVGREQFKSLRPHRSNPNEVWDGLFCSREAHNRAERLKNEEYAEADRFQHEYPALARHLSMMMTTGGHKRSGQ